MSTRKLSFGLAIALLVCLAAAANTATPPRDLLPAGALRDSPSLYLREASAGPVRWQPWSGATFAMARKLNRPLLIDIGAVWCHWCHVMDQTTYADPEVANLLNREFVPIKIDSDQRPDLDAYYQNVASQVFNTGGWPLACIALPDGAPVLAFGYLPPRPGTGPAGAHADLGMIGVLTRAADAFEHDRPNLERATADIQRRLAGASAVETASSASLGGLRAAILASLDSTYDHRNGGFSVGEGARFYDFPAIELALAHGFFAHPNFDSYALDSLRKLADGGVFDQLGGGFHRYSTDSAWRVPHFEKLLSDQAMALSAYSHAFESSGDPRFAEIARAIIGYVNRTMLDPNTHTFYSHQDADAYSGDDGSYYTWTREEVAAALPPKSARAALLYFGFDDDPALAPDGRIVLRRAMPPDVLAKRLALPRAQSDVLLAGAIAAMRKVRERRPAPRVDRVVMIDRNALMATAYLTAASALGDPSLRAIALADLDYLLAHARASDGSFDHSLSNSTPAVPGFIADQVYMLGALAAAAQSSGEPRYLDDAAKLAGLIITNFRQRKSGLLINRTPADGGVAVAPAGAEVFFDRPAPSIQASAAIALSQLGAITGESRWNREASSLLSSAPAYVGAEGGPLLGTLGLALEADAVGTIVVAISGSGSDLRTRRLMDEALRTYRPGKVVIASDRARAAQLPPQVQSMIATHAPNEPIAFVCMGRTCAKPVADPQSLAKLVREFGAAPAKTIASQ